MLIPKQKFYQNQKFYLMAESLKILVDKSKDILEKYSNE